MLKTLCLALISICLALPLACGNDISEPPEPAAVCTPDPELEPKSCWVNDKKEIMIRSISDFEEICNSPCTKAFQISLRGPVEGLKDLRPLSNLREIVGLGIIGASDLQNFRGLEELRRLDGLGVDQTKSLRNFEGFGKAEDLEFGLEITDNEALRSLEGLDITESIGEKNQFLRIMKNPKLRRIGALDKLKEVKGHLNIQANGNLQEIDGFRELQTVRKNLNISNNSNLESITSLESLRKVEGDKFDISDNPNLPRCQAYDLKSRLLNFQGRTYVQGNGPCDEK